MSCLGKDRTKRILLAIDIRLEVTAREHEVSCSASDSAKSRRFDEVTEVRATDSYKYNSKQGGSRKR